MVIRNPRDSISVCFSKFWSINSNCALRYQHSNTFIGQLYNQYKEWIRLIAKYIFYLKYLRP